MRAPYRSLRGEIFWIEDRRDPFAHLLVKLLSSSGSQPRRVDCIASLTDSVAFCLAVMISVSTEFICGLIHAVDRGYL